MMIMVILKSFIRKLKGLFKKDNDIIYVAPCGTVIKKLPFTIDIPEGYELPKFDPRTGKAYYHSDGKYAPHIILRKIGDPVPYEYEPKTKD